MVNKDITVKAPSYNIANLTDRARQTEQPKAQRVEQSTDLDIQNVARKTLEQDIYHKSKHIPQDKSTYDRPINIEYFEFELSAVEVTQKEFSVLYFGELPNKLGQVNQEYKALKQEISKQAPSLLNKDWGFTLDENSKLIITGELSEQEQSYLQHKFDNNEAIGHLAKDIPEILSRGLTFSRGYGGKSYRWGKYDVTAENFKNIIDIRELLEASTTKISHLVDGGIDKFAYMNNMEAQLAWRAEPKYSW